MESNKESLSEFLTKLNVLYNNMNLFLTTFSESLNSTADYLTVNQIDYAGNQTSYQIPAVGAMKGQISAITKNFESLIGVNGDSVGIVYSDGTTRYFELKKMSELITDLEAIGNSTFTVPADFRVKNNWFFESFLNPALFVSTDVSQYTATGEVDKFSVKRVIVNTDTADKQTYFDQAYKGRNDIDYNTMINDLTAKGVAYNIDDNVVDLPTAINRYRGSFTVLSIYNTTGTNPRYALDTITYVDILASGNGTMSLNVNDILVTSQDSEYKVVFVDKENNIVELALLFGSQPITQGTAVLKIKPVPYVVPELQINVGYNEREAIFVRPISATMNLTTDKISKGFAVFTNELTMLLSDNTSTTLESYYNTYVADFGQLMLSFAQEKQLPASAGIPPDAPVLDATNLKVVQINKNITNSSANAAIQTKISSKIKIESDIAAADLDIQKNVTDINSPQAANESFKLAAQTAYNQNIEKRNGLTTSLKTLVDGITSDIQTTPSFTVAPEYAVQGFIPIPAAKVTPMGNQEVIQFIVSYRKLSKNGNAPDVTQVGVVQSDGTTTTGFVSNWTEATSKIRTKTFDDASGKYIWDSDNIQDADAVNMSQLNIPIGPGEQVEIRVKAVSESGWPINPVKSEWSQTAMVTFPEELEIVTSSVTQAQQIMQTDTVLQFEADLQAMNLDQHLLGSFVTGDKYYAHNSDVIASGFYMTDGTILTLFQKLKDLDSRCLALEQAITREQGVIKITITDPKGNVIEVKNGSTVSFLADSYKSMILNQSNTLDHGKIITQAYTVSIQNTSATALELTSRLSGGIDESMPFIDFPSLPATLTGDADYDNNRIYGNTPLAISSLSDQTVGNFKQKPPYQSGQAKSQIVYTRFKNFGLSGRLYEYHMGNHSASSFDPTLEGNHSGSVVPDYDNINVPFWEAHLVPYDPNIKPDSGSSPRSPEPTYVTDSNVWHWNGGDGYKTEFCIHKTHPAVLSGGILDGVDSLAEMKTALFPTIDSVTNQTYIPISHALYIDVANGEHSAFEGVTYGPGNAIMIGTGLNPAQQCQFRQVSVANDTDMRPYHYPIKQSFISDDEYLIGKYTCGAYLFVAPVNYEGISVDGNHPLLSNKAVGTGPSNAINFTVIFQYRCSDKIEEIGGYRLPAVYGNKLTNVGYRKKIGLDIYIRDTTKQSGNAYGNIFSFDIQVDCVYDNTLQGAAGVSSSTGTYSTVTY